MTSCPSSQDEVTAWLLDPATHGGNTVEHIETHISHVFLVGDVAYKMKRDVRLPFVDFSTLDGRGAACRDELALNSRTAPEIYRDVIPVTREEGNALRLDGQGTVVEWLVRMNRFDDSLLFDRLALHHELTTDRVLGLADAVAELHQSTPPVILPDGGDPFSGTFRDLVKNLRDQTVDTVVADAVALWTQQAERAFEEGKDHIASRAAAGHVRHCHGDLHLRNICEIEGRVRLFDALEFDPEMATIDRLYDFSFVLMDLIHRDLRVEAAIALSRYLSATRDFSGLSVLPLFMSVRAAVRALVAMLSPAGHAEALDYLDLATNLLAPAPIPRLIAVGGRSGTGKTTVSRALAAACHGPFGALMIRSDNTRKRLAGLQPEERLSGTAYTSTASKAVYTRMISDAHIALNAGACVILDATFLDADARDDVARAAAAADVPFIGIWLTAEDAVMEARIAARGRDASDADWTVLRGQREPHDLGKWRVMDASKQDIDEWLALASA